MPEQSSSNSTILAERYRVIRELGSGGMATVYLCEDISSNDQVALKVLHPYLHSVVTTRRFLREIEYVADLDHPAIPKVIASGVIGEVPFFTMMYVKGESLRERLVREGRLTVEEAVSIITRVIEPLTYAHGRGILHRDIKPENILLSSSGVHVLDFGVARALTRSSGDRLTSTGLTVGTPAYVSPEQALAEKDLDERSDVYSLGCVAYELITGAQPFTGRTPQSIVARRFVAPPPRLRSVRPEVPPFVDDAVAKALAENKEERWAKVADFARALAGESDAETAPTSNDSIENPGLFGTLRRAFKRRD